MDDTFYVCGPPDFVEDVSSDLEDVSSDLLKLGADESSIVVEE